MYAHVYRLLITTLGVLVLVGCADERTHEAKADPLSKATVTVEQKPAPLPMIPAVPTLKPFRDAVVQDVPDGENRPPDKTVVGQSVGRLYEKVAGQVGEPGLFDQVKFTDVRGRKIRYIAIVKTELGDVHIDLLGDSAPNHVRNFVALARAGYFNGLPFHRSVRQQLDGKFDAYVETGCPLGTGEPGYGSIGYWLRPEIAEDQIHEEGTVGAWHGSAKRGAKDESLVDLDNAACKFYITLTKSAWRDQTYTIFGKVVQGLEVVRTINERPNQVDPSDRPRQPVLIREVLIEEILVAGPLVARRD